jgi:hypothetical protein
MKYWAIDVRTIDGKRTFMITAESKAAALLIFFEKWEDQLVSCDVLAVTEMLVEQ